MIKHTAVQFVVNELEKLTGLNLKDEPIIEQALQMEKEQIMQAFGNGKQNGHKNWAHKYYKETYETQND